VAKNDDTDLLNQLARPKAERDKFMFYLSKKLHADFKKVCGTAPLSRVLETLIQDFVERNKGRR